MWIYPFNGIILRSISALQSKPTRNTLVAKQVEDLLFVTRKNAHHGKLGCFSRKILERTLYRVWDLVGQFVGRFKKEIWSRLGVVRMWE